VSLFAGALFPCEKLNIFMIIFITAGMSQPCEHGTWTLNDDDDDDWLYSAK